MRRVMLIALLLFLLLLLLSPLLARADAIAPAPPTVNGCQAALCLDGTYYTPGIATGHRFCLWYPLQQDARFGVLAAFNDGGQFLGWCILSGDGSDYHLASATELAPLGPFVPGWYDPKGTVQADIPPAVKKILKGK